MQILAGKQTLANFAVPLELRVRRTPEPPPKPESASEIVRAGWDHFLFARFSEAEAAFKKAIEKDPSSAEARTGLALLSLDSDPRARARRPRTRSLPIPITDWRVLSWPRLRKIGRPMRSSTLGKLRWTRKRPSQAAPWPRYC